MHGNHWGIEQARNCIHENVVPPKDHQREGRNYDRSSEGTNFWTTRPGGGAPLAEEKVRRKKAGNREREGSKARVRALGS